MLVRGIRGPGTLLAHVYPGRRCQFSHSFRRDAYRAVRGACGRQYFVIPPSERCRNKRAAGAPARKDIRRRQGCPVALTTSSLLNIRAFAPKVVFKLLIIQAGIAFRDHQDNGVFYFKRERFSYLPWLYRCALWLPARQSLYFDLIR